MAFNLTLRKLFLYLFASVGLVLCIIGTVSIINLGLRSYVFTKSDFPCAVRPVVPEQEREPGTEEQRLSEQEYCEQQRVSDKQRQAANAIAMLIVGVPLYAYHWNTIRRDKEV